MSTPSTPNLHPIYNLPTPAPSHSFSPAPSATTPQAHLHSSPHRRLDPQLEPPPIRGSSFPWAPGMSTPISPGIFDEQEINHFMFDETGALLPGLSLFEPTVARENTDFTTGNQRRGRRRRNSRERQKFRHEKGLDPWPRTGILDLGVGKAPEIVPIDTTTGKTTHPHRRSASPMRKGRRKSSLDPIASGSNVRLEQIGRNKTSRTSIKERGRADIFGEDTDQIKSFTSKNCLLSVIIDLTSYLF
jgi:hypothetical protein